ncbi:hypothetical protein DFJ58DRAFT_805803 [Suillus subalutaceus]|uniref:uncharacterized protein n=1 Tax=Suillus subalutaceus TaxID=48586 RepID=UPI001B864322|nr:uncharacterized protein DFJ58DRAFT_805803 [Suillus subalutaceus]KAG1842773.1 hypothetical protein DFJ58DRAFT_805803 [Suillus subalutaceus]
MDSRSSHSRRGLLWMLSCCCVGVDIVDVLSYRAPRVNWVFPSRQSLGESVSCSYFTFCDRTALSTIHSRRISERSLEDT